MNQKLQNPAIKFATIEEILCASLEDKKRKSRIFLKEIKRNLCQTI
jgi:hypothetical protein